MKKAFLKIFLVFALLPVRSAAQDFHSLPQARPIKTDTLSLFIIGDVMMHSAQFGYDHRKFLKNVSHRMRGADICIANMELTLGGKPYSGYPAFSSPEYIAEYLAGECGADIRLTSNNHIMDRGSSGLERTLKIYSSLRDSTGTVYTGSALSPEDRESNFPLTFRRKGIKIAIINCTYGTNARGSEDWPRTEYMDRENLGAAFRRARESGADFIVALPHWGVEYSLRHSPEQEKWAEWMTGQGADIIVGTHPHVVQDTAHIGKVPVIYSLGNAVSNMSAPNTRLELAVSLSFTKDIVTGSATMLEPRLHFMWCCLPGRLTDSYSTVFVDEWLSRRNAWILPADHDNMTATLRRVTASTGINTGSYEQYSGK